MRYPAVAGMFYPADKEELRADVEKFISAATFPKIKLTRVLGAIVPHAGYMYSGSIAGICYSFLKTTMATTFVIICPNHTGRGAPIAISRDDWQTPLGIVRCDRELAEAIGAASALADFDESAHTFEHACEVQLPFVQTIAPTARTVCACMALQSYEAAKDIAAAIASATKEIGRDIALIASSDFTHFEPHEVAKAKDTRAIKLLEELKAEDFVSLCEGEGLSICGYGPIAAAIEYTAKLGGSAKLLKYATSGDVTGDFSSVVGYAAIALYK